MRTSKASRIRFALLEARWRIIPHRLTPWQTQSLYDCDAAGWIIGDIGTAEAHDRHYAQLRSAKRSSR